MAQSPALHGHSSGDRAWLAVPARSAEGGAETALLVRVKEAEWRVLTRVPARVRDVADVQGTAAVLLENGEWMLVWPQGGSGGAGLPGGGRMLRLAGSNDQLWAVGTVAGGMGSLTTQPLLKAQGLEPRDPAVLSPPPKPPAPEARVTQVPGSSPAPPPSTSASETPAGAVLFERAKGKWLARAELPDVEADAVGAMAVEAGQVILAIRETGGVVRVRKYVPDEGWIDLARVKTGDESGAMSCTRRWLWAAGKLWRLDEAGTEPVELRSTRPVPAGADQTVIGLGEQILLLFLDGGKLYEQRCDLNGAAIGQAMELGPVDSPAQPKIEYWLNLLVMVLLAVVFLATLGRRRAIQEAMQRADRPRPAALWARAAAAVLDGTPWVAVHVAYVLQAGAMDDPWMVLHDQRLIWWSLAADGVYIVHCMVGELLYGRSLGKWLLGLRVVRLDGRPASAGAIVVRNLLRIVDLLALITLAMVVLSPLRQRVGDIAAGTLVVDDGGVAEEAAEDKETQEREVRK